MYRKISEESIQWGKLLKVRYYFQIKYSIGTFPIVSYQKGTLTLLNCFNYINLTLQLLKVNFKSIHLMLKILISQQAT